MDINFIDIGIIIFIVITALIGLGRGFVWTILFLTTWIAAAGIAFFFHDELMANLPFTLSSEVLQRIVAGLIIFLVVLFIGTLLNYLLSKAIKVIGLGTIDRLLGVLFGVALSGLIVSMGVMFASLTKYTEKPMWQSSILVPKFATTANWIQENAPQQMALLLEEAGISTPVAPVITN